MILQLLLSLIVVSGSIIALMLLITAYIYAPHRIARKHIKKIQAKLDEMVKRLDENADKH